MSKVELRRKLQQNGLVDQAFHFWKILEKSFCEDSLRLAGVYRLCAPLSPKERKPED